MLIEKMRRRRMINNNNNIIRMNNILVNPIDINNFSTLDESDEARKIIQGNR